MSDEIVQLLISMIVAYDDYGDNLGYTKKELDDLIKYYNLLSTTNNYNELGAMVLYSNDYISKDTLADKLNIKYEDGEFWMVFSGFEDILPSNYDFEVKVLDGDGFEDWTPSDYHDYDIDFSDFTIKTLESIVDYCVRHKCYIEIDFEDVEVTKSNSKIKKGKYPVLFINGNNISQHISDDGMLELKDTIQYGISDAYDSEQQSAIYREIKSSFEDEVGEWKIKTINSKEHIYVKVSDPTLAKDELFDSYDGEYHSGEEYFGSLQTILYEYDMLSFSKPNYSYIDDYPGTDSIDECVRERLSWE